MHIEAKAEYHVARLELHLDDVLYFVKQRSAGEGQFPNQFLTRATAVGACGGGYPRLADASSD